MRQTLEAFGIKKSRTSVYHPQGDGMVERFNRSLLQLLQTYIEREDEWECHLSWALFAYRSAVHASTGVSPFFMMFGRQPKLPPITSSLALDSTTYNKHLCAKFAQLLDFVHANLVEAGLHQKTGYDSHSLSWHFNVGGSWTTSEDRV